MSLEPSFIVGLATLLGLLVGSFLNVVIYRLPLMMNREEKAYAWHVLQRSDDPLPPELLRWGEALPEAGERFVPPAEATSEADANPFSASGDQNSFEGKRFTTATPEEALRSRLPNPFTTDDPEKNPFEGKRFTTATPEEALRSRLPNPFTTDDPEKNPFEGKRFTTATPEEALRSRLPNPFTTDDPEKNPFEGKRFNLMTPPSRCPHCGSVIRAWQNIPVLSYLLQRGKCAHCRTPISPRYACVELLTALLSFLVARHFINEPGALALGLLFTWALVALFFIDMETQYLPDVITLPLLWLGLAVAVLPPLWEGREPFIPISEAVIGAMAGYGVLWLVFWGFKLLTGKEGMGYGDFKLLAALGAWQGASVLPFILFASAAMGLAFALARRIGFGREMAFGPFLAIAGWSTFLYGPELMALLGM